MSKLGLSLISFLIGSLNIDSLALASDWNCGQRWTLELTTGRFYLRFVAGISFWRKSAAQRRQHRGRADSFLSGATRVHVQTFQGSRPIHIHHQRTHLRPTRTGVARQCCSTVNSCGAEMTVNPRQNGILEHDSQMSLASEPTTQFK